MPGLGLNQVTGTPRLLLMGDYGWYNQWDPRPHSSQELKEQAEWHERMDHHNLAFMDGHVGFTKIRKGYYITESYTVVPFQELFSLAREVQGPVEE